MVAQSYLESASIQLANHAWTLICKLREDVDIDTHLTEMIEQSGLRECGGYSAVVVNNCARA